MTKAKLLRRGAALLILIALGLPSVAYAAVCQIKIDQPASEQSKDEPGTTNVAPRAFTYQFESGARWDFCWHIDAQAGLTISNVHYGAPEESSIKLLQSASLAQILFKYDEDTHAEPVVSDSGLGGTNHIAPNAINCPADDSQTDGSGSGICVRVRDINTMTSVRRSDAKRRHELSLHALSNVGAQTFEQVWRFSEDGQLTPAVRVSGVLDRFTNSTRFGTAVTPTGPLAANATLLFTWRLDFNIANTPYNDIVEQIDFVPQVSNVVRRAITTQPLNAESFHKVNRTQFRGWLIKDAELSAVAGGTTRMGYYLDPQSSGFGFVSRQNNWALFDLSVTNNRACEQLASNNTITASTCGDSLDQFVNGESLLNQDPVIWFSLARQFIPKAEDFPAITTREASFKLIPFDWSASTPFTPLEQ